MYGPFYKVIYLACGVCTQLEDGDIICFQKSSPVERGEQFRYPDVPSFLDYVHNRQVCLPPTLYKYSFFQKFFKWLVV
jgi:hypothetical protein